MVKFLKDTTPQEPDKIRTQQEVQIMQLEQRIENLKNFYTLFFNGELKLPPEKEREELQKAVRNISQNESRSPRINMLLQNLISRFNLYNNMWLKKMSELESGITSTPKKSKPAVPPKPKVEKIPGKSIEVNLNNEKSFEAFYQVYCELTGKKPEAEEEKEKAINMIKSKLIFNNLITGNVEMSVNKGKLSLKIKKQE